MNLIFLKFSAILNCFPGKLDTHHYWGAFLYLPRVVTQSIALRELPPVSTLYLPSTLALLRSLAVSFGSSAALLLPLHESFGQDWQLQQLIFNFLCWIFSLDPSRLTFDSFTYLVTKSVLCHIVLNPDFFLVMVQVIFHTSNQSIKHECSWL